MNFSTPTDVSWTSKSISAVQCDASGGTSGAQCDASGGSRRVGKAIPELTWKISIDLDTIVSSKFQAVQLVILIQGETMN